MIDIEQLRSVLSKVKSGEEFNSLFTGILFEDFCRSNNLSTENPNAIISELKKNAKRKICQYQFQKNDIVWICKNCQVDDTCVLCNECFQNSNHDGHDVYFYHSLSGGCCDCGDECSWSAKGFCNKHGNSGSEDRYSVPDSLRSRGDAIFEFCATEIVALSQNCNLYSEVNDIDPSIECSENADWMLVLINDDIHTFDDVTNALYAIPLTVSANQIAQSVHTDGHFVLATGSFNNMKNMCVSLFHRCDLHLRIFPAKVWQWQGVVIHMISWLRSIALLSDGLCKLICNHFTPERLSSLIDNDAYCHKAILEPSHNLMLALMADEVFKMSFAITFCNSYSRLMIQHRCGLSLADNSVLNLSVQFLNRYTCVVLLADKFDFFRSICDSLVMMGVIDVDNFAADVLVRSRRYMSLLGDIKIFSALTEISRRFLSSSLFSLIKLLSSAQWMDPQVRQIQNHVEYESSSWMIAFNHYLGIFSVVEYLYKWLKDPASNRMAPVRADKSIYVGAIKEAMMMHKDELHEIEETPDEVITSGFVSCEDESRFARILISGASLLDNLAFFIDKWFVNDYEGSKGYSFHIPLHRAYGKAIGIMCGWEHHLTSLLDHFAMLTTPLANRNNQIAYSIFLPALKVLSFSSQIRVGLWKRNGSVMMDQLLNYSESSLSSAFRNHDIVLLQTSCIFLSPEVAVSSFLENFMLGHIAKSEKGYRLVPIAHESMLEELLILLIVIVSECPLECSVDSRSRIKTLMRRAIIHRLASGPASFSSIMEGLSYIHNGIDIENELVRDVLSAVSESRPSLIDDTKYALRTELWSEYDPCFSAVSRSSHQSILEIRPKAKEISPFVLPPPKCHQYFSKFRLHLLVEPRMWQIVKDILLSFVSAHFQHAYCTSSVGVKKSMTLFTRSLHYITLVLHLSKDCAENADLILQRFTSNDCCDNIENVECVSMLKLLLDLKDYFSSTRAMSIETEFQYHVSWILDTLVSRYPSISNMLPKPNESKKVSSSPSKGSNARLKALSSLKASADAFAAMLESDDEKDSDAEMELEKPFSGTGLDLQCLLCQSDNAEDLALLGFCHISKLYFDRDKRVSYCQPCQDYSSIEGKHHISLCGHAMHVECFDAFIETEIIRSRSLNGLLLDPNRGQFSCPLCKKLNNLILPLDPACSRFGTRGRKRKIELDSAAKSDRNIHPFLFNSQLLSDLQVSSSAPKLSNTLLTSMFKNFTLPIMSITTDSFPTDAPLDSFPLDISFGFAFESLVGGISYSMNVADIESNAVVIGMESNQSGIESQLGVDDGRFAAEMISSISYVLKASGLATFVHNRLLSLISGDSSKYSCFIVPIFDRSLDVNILPSKWLDTLCPFLALPLLDGVSLSIAIAGCNEVISDDIEFGLIGFSQWLCMGHLVQLIIDAIINDKVPRNESFIFDDIPILKKMCIELFGEVKSSLSFIESDFSCVPWDKILWRWSSFIRCTSSILSNCRLMPKSTCDKCFSPLDVTSDIMKATIDVMNLMPLLSSIDLVIPRVSLWLSSLSSFGFLTPNLCNSIVKCLAGPFPMAKPMTLLDLESSYTTLHCTLTQNSGLEAPAICLHCGLVLNGKGKEASSGEGAITRHIRDCCGEAGAVFLLQTCQMLLCFGPRACSFPSPYVDEYGEKHKSSRGKPLFLDSKLYEMFRRICAAMKIPREVMERRRSSGRVIVLGYY